MFITKIWLGSQRPLTSQPALAFLFKKDFEIKYTTTLGLRYSGFQKVVEVGVTKRQPQPHLLFETIAKGFKADLKLLESFLASKITWSNFLSQTKNSEFKIKLRFFSLFLLAT
jgi:hypothetical protein